MDIEKRAFEAEIEIRTNEGSDVPIVRGYASVFDKLSENLGGFREKIAQGAFDSVMGDDVRALFNHDPNFILARTKSGTLKLSVDDHGLAYEFTPPDTTAGRDLVESMRRGDVSQSSFAFTVADDNWTEDEDGRVIRTITQMQRLFDVSPVTYPAYPDASVGLRGLDAYIKAKETEQHKGDVDLEKRKLRLLEIGNTKDPV